MFVTESVRLLRLSRRYKTQRIPRLINYRIMTPFVYTEGVFCLGYEKPQPFNAQFLHFVFTTFSFSDILAVIIENERK